MTTTSFDTALSNLGIGRSADSSTALANATGSSTLGQADFLRLMTTQLQNQDPFNPVDNTQMISQMAQFSSLAGQSEMNSTLKAIADKLGATSSSEAMSWVGRTVLTEGDTAYPRTTGGFAGAIELDSDATEVNVSIADSTGKILKTVALGPQSSGTINYDWDGTTDDGSDAGSGPFKITVNARDADGTVTARPLVWAPVTSVSLPGTGDPVLSVAGVGQISASAVRQVG